MHWNSKLHRDSPARDACQRHTPAHYSMLLKFILRSAKRSSPTCSSDGLRLGLLLWKTRAIFSLFLQFIDPYLPPSLNFQSRNNIKWQSGCVLSVLYPQACKQLLTNTLGGSNGPLKTPCPPLPFKQNRYLYLMYEIMHEIVALCGKKWVLLGMSFHKMNLSWI